MLNETIIRSFARSILFNEVIKEAHMGPSNSNQGEFTDINYGMYNQHGPDYNKDKEELEELEEIEPIETNYVASVNFVDPTYDISFIETEYTPTNKSELKKATNVFIDSRVENNIEDIENIWSSIKKEIESYIG